MVSPASWKRRWAWLTLSAVLAAGQACELNPQPIPPEDQGGTGDAGVPGPGVSSGGNVCCGRGASSSGGTGASSSGSSGVAPDDAGLPADGGDGGDAGDEDAGDAGRDAGEGDAG